MEVLTYDRQDGMTMGERLPSIRRRPVRALALDPGRVNWPRHLNPDDKASHLIDMRHAEYNTALRRLYERLPRWAGGGLRYLVDSSPWVRVPPALALIVGGTFGFLPVLGFWMVPLGLILLAQDIPPMRKPIGKAINWADRKWPANENSSSK